MMVLLPTPGVGPAKPVPAQDSVAPVVDGSVDVNPKTGSVLVFQHDILHCGSELLHGIKYTLRTDVMYAPMA